MKPLELHIYDKHPDADAYRVGGFFSPYCLVSRDKRFSDAELAAEWWCSSWRAETPLTSSAIKDESFRRAPILAKFASSPHAHESDYQ